MTQVAHANSMVLKDEPIIIWVKELWDNAVIFTFRTWVNTADYWNAFFALTEEVKKAFDATNGELNFPFPQRDVHMYNAK
jgi:small conductance mechanosensitive channel